MADYTDLPQSLLKQIAEARKNPRLFAEMLIEPKSEQRFKPNFLQTQIFDSRAKTTWIAANRREGKCLTADAKVIHPETLEPVSISEAVLFSETFVFDFVTNTIMRVPCTWKRSGAQKCLRLKLGSGEQLTLTYDHLLFHWKKGWVPANSLKVGDRILSPAIIPVFGDTVPPPQQKELDIQDILDFKKIPTRVYSYDAQALQEFIVAVWVQYGRCFNEFSNITFMFWNSELALSFRHLLIRFGVDSRLDSDNNLVIDDVVDIDVFLHLIGLELTVTQVRSPRKWDVVVDKEKAGERPTFDLVVDHPDHNFIANNVVVHNSFSLAVLALWHAITSLNQDIVIFAPSSTQVNELFDTIDSFMIINPWLRDLQAPKSEGGNHRNPQQRTFATRSKIKGQIMGMSGRIEGGKRGLTPIVSIIDEAQLMDKEDWAVLSPMMDGNKFYKHLIRNYVTGTIREPVGWFYEKMYTLPVQDNEKRIFIPINQNPDYTLEEVEQIRKTQPEHIWISEYLLQVTAQDAAVFKKENVERACQKDYEYGPDNINDSLVRFIGVDWDKAVTGTNIVVFQYSPNTERLQVIYREEVPSGEDTYLRACQRIIDLYLVYQPELVVTDQGAGEAQFEFLRDRAMTLGIDLASRLEKKAFNEKLEIMNYSTGEVERKQLKNFLVGRLQLKLQEGLFEFPEHDEPLRNQLITYRVKAISSTGNFKFSSTNEHIIDCCLFAMYGLWFIYENQFDRERSKHSLFVDSGTLKVPIQEEIEKITSEQLEDGRYFPAEQTRFRSQVDDYNVSTGLDGWFTD